MSERYIPRHPANPPGWSMFAGDDDTPKPNGADRSHPAQPFPLIAATVWAQQPPPEWLLPGFLLQKSLAIVFGESGCGKSFLMSHVSHVLSGGCGWQGGWVDPAAVVIFATENPGSLAPRFAAMQAAMDADFSPLFIAPEPINLIDPSAGARMAATIKEAEKRCGLRVGLVVVDTFRDAWMGDEDKSQQVALALTPLKLIRDKFGITVALVHHSGHAGERERGSSVIRGSADTVWMVSNADGVRTVRCEKIRDGATPDPFGFTLKPLDDGRCIVEMCEAQAATRSKRRSLTGQNRVAFDALQGIVATNGELAPADLQLPSAVRVVRCDAWRAEFLARLGDMESNAKRQAYHRVIKTLQADGFIGVRNDFVWLARDHA